MSCHKEYYNVTVRYDDARKEFKTQLDSLPRRGDLLRIPHQSPGTTLTRAGSRVSGASPNARLLRVVDVIWDLTNSYGNVSILAKESSVKGDEV